MWINIRNFSLIKRTEATYSGALAHEQSYQMLAEDHAIMSNVSIAVRLSWSLLVAAFTCQ